MKDNYYELEEYVMSVLAVNRKTTNLEAYDYMIIVLEQFNSKLYPLLEESSKYIKRNINEFPIEKRVEFDTMASNLYTDCMKIRRCMSKMENKMVYYKNTTSRKIESLKIRINDLNWALIQLDKVLNMFNIMSIHYNKMLPKLGPYSVLINGLIFRIKKIKNIEFERFRQKVKKFKNVNNK